jgi:hypothetical protein
MLLGSGTMAMAVGVAAVHPDVGGGVPAAGGTDRFGVLETVLAESGELEDKVDRISCPGRYPAAFLFFLHEHRFVI